MTGLRSVALFCGSRTGTDPRFAEAARAFGAGVAAAGRTLVFGGGRVGLMGIAADAALAAGGTVLGIMPDFLRAREVAHPNLTRLVVTKTMHDRKARIYAEADAFIGLPGGIGTMDELIEIITWRHLRQHDKPILIADIAGSASAFLAAIQAAIDMGFSGPEVRGEFEVLPSVPAVLARLETVPPGGTGQIAHL